MLDSILLAAGETGAAAQNTVQQTAGNVQNTVQQAAGNTRDAVQNAAGNARTVQPAPGAARQEVSQQQPSAWGFLVPIMIVLVVMTFISGRSQKKQRDKQQKMFASIVKGSKVRTIGGFTAKVVEVREESLLIELADKMPPVEILKNAVAVVLDETKTADAAKK